MVQWKALNEIDAGTCDGKTYGDIEKFVRATVFVCVCVYVYVCICVYVCVYVCA